MIKRPEDVIVYLIGIALLVALVFFVRGYYILIRYSLQHRKPGERLRILWDWQGHEPALNYQALRFIYRGAAITGICFLTFGLLMVWMFFTLR